MIHLPVEPVRPDAAAIGRARDAIRAGGVVAIPTDTLYGLAADPFNPVAVARVFAIKGRNVDRALPLIVADAMQLSRWLGPLTPLATRLAAAFWPGPLTMVVCAPPLLAAIAGPRQTVAVRVPAHDVARALCVACGHPLTATSANISGEPATENPDTVAARLGQALDALLDAGPTAGGPSSTIVDVTGEVVQLVRAGAISWERVQACVEHA